VVCGQRQISPKQEGIKCYRTADYALAYVHHPFSSTVGVRETVLGVGDATDCGLYMDATDCGLYDAVDLLAYDTADPGVGYNLGACLDCHTEDCGGVSLRGC